MKKKILVIAAVLMLALSLCACGQKFTCDLCAQEKSGKDYGYSGMHICKECYNANKAEIDAAKEALEGLGELGK